MLQYQRISAYLSNPSLYIRPSAFLHLSSYLSIYLLIPPVPFLSSPCIFLTLPIPLHVPALPLPFPAYPVPIYHSTYMSLPNLFTPNHCNTCPFSVSFLILCISPCLSLPYLYCPSLSLPLHIPRPIPLCPLPWISPALFIPLPTYEPISLLLHTPLPIPLSANPSPCLSHSLYMPLNGPTSSSLAYPSFWPISPLLIPLPISLPVSRFHCLPREA